MEENKPKDGSISKVESINIEKRGKPKGLPKSGGRQKGTPNKSSSKWAEIIAEADFCVPTRAIALFEDPNTPPNIKFNILQFLASYTAASIKPKEIETEVDVEAGTLDVLTILKPVKEDE